MDYHENPKTRREDKKTAKEKKQGKDRLGSGKGARAAEANQNRGAGRKNK
jgi:ribosome assembly protein YihI (activator of Der GTPase)